MRRKTGLRSMDSGLRRNDRKFFAFFCRNTLQKKQKQVTVA
jgi:hypothetical protein